MTNAEKFKEDFGHEPHTNCPFDVYCPQCKWNNDRTDCISKFWQSEYQGTPTIPLSVIEDIKAEIETNIASLDGYIELSDFGKGVRGGLSKALEIIDRKVNSPKTLSSNGEYLESIDRKVNKVEHDKAD